MIGAQSSRRLELRPALIRFRSRLAQSSGVTITEMLVVLAILGVILAGMTTLFLSATTSQVEQSNRYQAQHNARLALDALRREIRCGTAVTAVTTSSLTITLPGYCQKPVAATEAPFTWCTVGGGAPYELWRYSGTSCSGTGTRKAESLASNAVFTYNRSTAGPAQAPPVAGGLVVGGFFQPGTYSYDVTAVVDAAGTEISGAVRSVTLVAGADKSLAPSQITVGWTYAGPPAALSYNVYGRDNGATTAEGLRLLANTTSTSYIDVGGGFSSLKAPPLGTVNIALALDLTVADAKQRFTLADEIVLRNSGRR